MMGLREWKNHCLELNQRYRVLPLILGTCLALALIALRIELKQEQTYLWMVWNLLLAWVPYWAALALVSIHHRNSQARWRLLPLGVLWLLFWPNAPYLITDLMHLQNIATMPVMYDVAMLAALALVGCFLGVLSLRMIHRVVRNQYGSLAGWLMVLGSSSLCGLGIYLGRKLRWNSWDALLNPLTMGRAFLEHLLEPRQFVTVLGFSGVFAGLVLFAYLMLPALETVEA